MTRMGSTSFPRIRIGAGAGRYIYLPVLTTTQRDALSASAGYMIYNSTTGQVEEYSGSTWRSVGQAILTTHAVDPDAHHSEEIPEGRGYYNTTPLLTLPGISPSGISTEALTANIVRYYPFKVLTPVTADRLVFEITVAGGAGKICRVGIYKADIDWQPTDLVVDSGELAIDSIAVVTRTISEALTEGRYLFAHTADDVATYRITSRGNPFFGMIPTLGANPLVATLYVNKAYAALADPGTAWNAVAGDATGSHHPVFLRISTP